MVQHESQFGSLVDLDPVLDEVFFDHYTQPTDMLETIFNVQESSKNKETDLRVGGFSDPVDFDQHGSIVYDTADEGYEVEYSHTQWVRGFQITQVMLEDMQYNAIFDSAANMGTAFGRKRAKDRASVFNNAFSTTGYDVKALCADDHPRSKSDSTSVDNNLTLALNSTNLETAITTLMSLGDDLGEEIAVMPDYLIVPRALRKTALELTGSELTPESANNAVNVHSGLTAIVSPYLTDTNAWFVVDSAMSRRYLKWYNRIGTEFTAEDSFDTLIRKYRGRMRYSFGWSDFRWIVGSNPS